MLSVPFIRQHLELVKQRLAVKNFRQPELVDELVALDDQRKHLQFEQDELLSKINAASKEIGLLMRTDKEAAEAKKQEVAQWKSALSSEKLTEIEKKVEALLYLLLSSLYQ